MNIPLVRQNYHKSNFSNGSTIIFLLSKHKAGLNLIVSEFCSSHSIF